MMRSTLLICTAICGALAFSAAGYGQTQQAPTKPTDPQLRTAMHEQIRQELAKFKNGQYLYSHSDLFQRLIWKRAAEKLGLPTSDAKQDLDAPLEQDTLIEHDVSNTRNDENETSIAISRSNPQVIIAGANDMSMYTNGMPAYTTTNAGRTWRTYRLPKLLDGMTQPGGDPMLTSDDKGNIYYAYLIYGSQDASGALVSDLLVAHSTDGKKWTNGAPVLGKTDVEMSFEDKEAIAVDMDPASPHHGRVYVVWEHYDMESGGSVQQISWSDDQGATWEPPHDISSAFGYFANVKVGKSGVVFVSSSCDSLGQHALFVSHDGGNTFTQHVIDSYVGYPFNFDSREGLKGDQGFRAFPYTAFDVDRRDNTIYMTYGTYGGNAFAAQFCTKSTDEGNNWSSPDNFSEQIDYLDHFLPWVSVDQSQHEAYVSFYSSEEDPLNVNSRFVRSTFSDPHRFLHLGNDLFDPLDIAALGNPFIGDYIGCDADQGYFAAAWTENRPNYNDGDIFAFVSSPVSSVEQSAQPINGKSLTVGEAYPNPVLSGVAHFRIESSIAEPVTIEVYSARGERVYSAKQALEDDITTIGIPVAEWSAGVYHCVIRNSFASVERNIVVLR